MNNKNYILGLVALVVSVAGVASLVRAYSGPPPKVIVEGNYIEAASPVGEANLSGTTNFNDLSVDSLTVSGAISGGNLTGTGSLTLTGTSTQNSLATVVSSGSLADATSTLFCVANPFAATSTVSARVNITNAGTSSWKLYVAPTTTIVGLASGQLVDNMLMEAALIATSSAVYVASGVTAGSSGFITSGGGTFSEIYALPGESICGQGILDGGALTGMTNPLNEMAGTYDLTWKL